MLNSENYDFSFSGLKTAVLYLLRDLEKKVPKTSDRQKLTPFICKEFQQAVIDVLAKKTIRAAREFRVKTIILAGGVAANTELRNQLAEKIKKELPVTNYLLPITSYTTDNAVMIAMAAYFHAKNPDASVGVSLKKLHANGNLQL